jgi:hypothetical protein
LDFAAVTNPVGEPLLNAADLASFQGSDPNWFLSVAGDTIRNFCQWHIFPSITVTELVPIQPEGTIMLPSLYVTDVAAITLDGLSLDPSAYEWHQAGYIKRIRHPYFQWPLWPLESEQRFREYPSQLARHAEVTYTHGYSTLPPVVAGVGMELANRAIELPSGVAKQISSGPYSIGFGELGIVLSDEQRRRLGPYTLVRF